MTKPLDPKEIVTTQELAISNMLEIAALWELLFEKGIITEEEFLGKFKKLDREMKERKGQSKHFKMISIIGRRAKIIDMR